MPSLAITGADSPLGGRVLRALPAGIGTIQRLVVIGDHLPDDVPAGTVTALLSPTSPDLVTALEGVDALVHLAGGPAPGPATDGAGESSAGRLARLRRLLDAAGKAGVGHLVHLSSAVVYGAWPDNAVPLAEDAPVRPDPRFGWAVEQAEAERLVAGWLDDHPSAHAAVLRPALVVAPEDEAFLVRALGGLRGVRAAGEPRPVQFVHVDDLAAAVVRCAADSLTGTYNVAPEGWIDDAQAAALATNGLPSPAVPARLVAPVRALLWRLGVGATPPSVAAYATHPWVVAGDRLRALGWTPAFTNEEAVVATTTASPIATLSPRRRQEVLLAITGGTFATIAGVAGWLIWRSRRRR